MTETRRGRRQQQVKTIKKELATKDCDNRGARLPGLRYCRLVAGVTQRELADMAGVHQSTISSLEHNKRRAYAKTIRLLCKALEVEPADLLCID
jgi:DNA-binding Xre family transcriptional regulator